jgi:hypothetical protein
MATDSIPAHLAWVLPDTAAIPPGRYRISAALKGAAPHGVDLTIIPAPATQTAEQESSRFAAHARAALALGDANGALDQADQRLKTKPADLPALHLRADALAALGRKNDAIAAYGKALDAFYAQNPNAPEPPLTLLRSLRAMSGGE